MILSGITDHFMNAIESAKVERNKEKNRAIVVGRPRRREVLERLGMQTAFLLWVGILTWGSAAKAQTPLEEADVIRLARLHSPTSTIARAKVSVAEAKSQNAGLMANPSLSWTRETVTTVPAGSQDIVIASVPIDVAGPLTSRSLVASKGAWAKAEASVLQTQGILHALLIYVEVVQAEAKVEILLQSLEHLEEASRISDRRELVGSASGYESTRLALAVELRRSQLNEARALLRSAKARLAPQLGVPLDALLVETTFKLMNANEEYELLKDGGSSREVIAEARNSQRWAQQARKRAAWTWLPNLALFGGMKYVTDFGGGYGYVAGLSLDIPIFDRGQDLRSEAVAQRNLAVARSQALRTKIDAKIQSALAMFQMAKEELGRFDSRTVSQVQQLLRSAQSGYREGERSIVELLDAQNAEIEVKARRLALRGMAKQAELRLRAAAGDFR